MSDEVFEMKKSHLKPTISIANYDFHDNKIATPVRNSILSDIIQADMPWPQSYNKFHR